MTRNQLKLFHYTKKEILSADYDKIDLAINDLISANEPEVYRALLIGCSIGKNHSVRVPWQFIVPSPKQPAIDYAFWQLIGWAPSNDVLPARIRKGKIKKVHFPPYESITNHVHGIKKLPSGFLYFKNLSVIDAENNEIEQLPEEYSQLRNITTLRLAQNKIQQFPTVIACWDKLQILHLQSNALEGTLPKSLCEIRSLIDLDLSDNAIRRLPESFGNLKKLNRLILSHNPLEFLPRSFMNLIRLTELGLQNNRLTTVESLIRKFTKLITLDLSHNELKTIPNEIGTFKGLSSLELSGNRGLRELPLGLSKLEKLKYLGLGVCEDVLPKAHLRYLKGKDLQEYFIKIKRKYGAIPRFSKKRIKKKNTEINNSQSVIQVSNNEKTNIKTSPEEPILVHKSPYCEETISTANLILSYLNSAEFETIIIGLEMLKTLNSPEVCSYIINEGLKFNFNKPFEIEQGSWRNNERIHVLCYIAFHFDYHNLKKFREVIFNTKKADFCLEYLRLGDFFWKLPNLETVEIDCQQSTIPNQIVSFSTIHTLKIEDAFFDSTAFLQSMKSLKKLEVSQCKSPGHESHVVSFDGIHNLELLEINYSEFQDLRILNMPNLLELDISMKNSSNIEISGCPNLKKINISIPKNSENSKLMIENTTNLSEFKIENFSLSNLQLGNNTLEKLERIELKYVPAPTIPEWLYDARNLKVLKANHCQLRFIDDSISKFSQLEELDLNQNWLKSISEEILQCNKLKKLSIHSSFKRRIRIPIPVYETKQFKLEHNITQVQRRRIERQSEQLKEKTFTPKSSSRG